jgi:hypothetical protein
VDGVTYPATLSTSNVAARQGCPGSLPFTLLIGSPGGGALRSIVWDPNLVPSAQSSIPDGVLLGLKPPTPQVFAGSLVPNGLRMVSVALHECSRLGTFDPPNTVERHTAGVATFELLAVNL